MIYDPLVATRPRRLSTGKSREDASLESDEPLSPAFLRELRRRLKDARDPTRYVVVSAFGPRFLLYYDVVSGAYPLNDVSHATLFKRREVASAVVGALGDGHAVMTVRLTREGRVRRITPLRTIVRETERRRRTTRIPRPDPEPAKSLARHRRPR